MRLFIDLQGSQSVKNFESLVAFFYSKLSRLIDAHFSVGFISKILRIRALWNSVLFSFVAVTGIHSSSDKRNDALVSDDIFFEDIFFCNMRGQYVYQHGSRYHPYNITVIIVMCKAMLVSTYEMKSTSKYYMWN